MGALDTGELKRLIALMHDMVEAASSANWQALSRLDSERRALLKYEPLGNQSDDSDELNKVQDSLQDQVLRVKAVKAVKGREQDDEYELLVTQIRTLDEKIISTVRAERTKLLAENRELSAQVKAKNRYAQTSSMS